MNDVAPGATEQQAHQREWHQQWSHFRDDERFLFEDWIRPLALEDFRGKSVLECGCGGGQHTAFVAPYAAEVTAVDLNTVDIARERNRQHENVRFVEADIARMDLGRQFDVVFSIGVIHHTDDPDLTIANLKRHVKPGGRLVVWVYSQEGNGLFAHMVEPMRRRFLSGMDRGRLIALSRTICAALYPPVYTLYRLPLPFLPYYEYFGNFRRLAFERNTLNVFDKLNAPQVQLITRARIERWFSDMRDVSILPYKGVSWTGVGARAA